MGDLKFVASHDTRFKMRSDSRVLLLQPHLPVGTATMTVAWGVGRKSSVLDSKVKTVCPEQNAFEKESECPTTELDFPFCPATAYGQKCGGPEDLCFYPS